MKYNFRFSKWYGHEKARLRAYETSNLSAAKTLEADAQAATTALNDLGWRDADARLYQDQRDYLSKHNGIRGLDLVASTEIERARDLFYRDGFVVVVDALTSQQLERLRAACDRAIHNIMALDKQRIGNRGSHRYSFGAASKTDHMMHDPAWLCCWISPPLRLY